MLTQAEVKRVLFREWPIWRGSHGGLDTHSQRSSFWMHMEETRPDLKFRHRGGDPWQYVQGWLNEKFGLPRGS